MDYSVLSPLGVHYIFLFWASLFFIAQFFFRPLAAYQHNYLI